MVIDFKSGDLFIGEEKKQIASFLTLKY